MVEVVWRCRGNSRGAKEPYCLTNLLAKGRQGRNDKGVHKSAGTKSFYVND
ncbi:MAG: hypothetical protein L0956_10065 [Candidatus Mariimomonas ferrooxydans]